MIKIKKEFIKTLNSLVGKYSAYQIWDDFIHLCGYTISNIVQFRRDRQDVCDKIIEKYSKKELALFDRLYNIMVVDMTRNPNQDFLGRIYNELNLAQKANAENYTSFEIGELLSYICIGNLKERLKEHYAKTNKCYLSVYDCTCGSGVLLLAVAKHCRDGGLMDCNMLFVGQDLSSTAAMMCYIQLSLLGCAGYVVVGNTLTQPLTGNILFPPKDAFCTPIFFKEEWKIRRVYTSMRAKINEPIINLREKEIKCENKSKININSRKSGCSGGIA